MNNRLLLFLIPLTILSFSFKTLENEVSYFIQFKIETISSNDQAILIDQKMRQKSGISISRTDYQSGTYFCILKPEIQYTQEDFVKWFNKLGYHITCFNTGIQGKDQAISPFILKNCKI